MRQNSIYRYYAFGYNYALILSSGLQGKTKASALSTLKDFFRQLDDLEMQVTSLVAEDLRATMQKIEQSEAPNVADDHAQALKAGARKLDATLDAELKLRKAYLLTKKRYPIETLLQKPEELLAAGAWEKLSDTAKRDFRLATVQVALNQPTASAFHLMRALEDHVKCLYFAFKKTKRLEKPMWGPMTSQLRAKRPPKPSDKLLNHLDGMRVHFRNPTQHPETFYTADECHDLLNQTIAALNMISAELPS